MAISVVGVVVGATNNGGNVTLTLPAGRAEDDVVVLWGGHFFRAGTNIGPLTAGYTQQALVNAANPGAGVWTKRLSASPDATVVGQGTANNADATAYGAIVLRGVDATTPIDAVIGSVAGADPAAVTVATAGAAVLVLASGAPAAADTTPGTISGYTVPTITGTANAADTNDAHVLITHLLNASAGVQNPAAWSTLTGTGYHQFTVAIRPQPTVTNVPVGLITAPAEVAQPIHPLVPQRVAVGQAYVTPQIPLSGLHARYRASSLSLTDGAAVTSWPDDSGNGYTLEQATAAYQPVYVASDANFDGKPSVYFNGDRLENLAWGTLNQPDTIVAAVYWPQPWNGGRVYSGQDWLGQTQILRNVENNSQFEIGAGLESRIPGVAGVTLHTINWNGGNTATPDFDGSTWWINGELKWQSPRWPEWNAEYPGTQPLGTILSVGARGSFAGAPYAAMVGNVAELLFYDRLLTDAERMQVHGYMQFTYGIKSPDGGSDVPTTPTRNKTRTLGLPY